MKSYFLDFDNVFPIIFFVLFLASVASLQYCVRRNTRQNKRYFWLLSINIAVFCSLFFLLCLGGELYFHFCYDSSDSFSITKTGDDWFRKHFNSNSWGFRDNVDYVQQLIPGKRRITFIGDSFTAGQGIANVEDRFTNCIRSMRPRWDVHVLSECGSDSIDELSLVKQLVSDQYQFDKVVLVYT